MQSWMMVIYPLLVTMGIGLSLNPEKLVMQVFQNLFACKMFQISLLMLQLFKNVLKSSVFFFLNYDIEYFVFVLFSLELNLAKESITI